MTLDTIALEVLWSRLLSVANEQQVTLMRTAFSTVVRETQDLACGIFDTRGAMIAQSLTGTPGHINAMATGVRHFLGAFPAQTLAPGDVLLTNDPWLTAGQVNDMTVLTPVFQGPRVVAYFASTCHAPDIGGRILSAEAREVYEEGLRIPMTRLFAAGEPNHELLRIIRAMREGLEGIQSGRLEIPPGVVSFAELTAILGIERWAAVDDAFGESRRYT